MRQAVMTKFKKIEVLDNPVPELRADEVLLKIDACGICGSDLHIYTGNHPTIVPPVVMGHEFAGRVVKTGPAVTQWQVGDYAAGIPGVGCRECEDCRSGKFNLCKQLKVIGGYYPGAFAEYTAVPETNLIRLPERFTAEEGAMLESLAVAVHIARRFTSVEGKAFAVFGAGPIGLLVIQVLKAFGARLVLSSDPIPVRREIAQKLGADFAINPMEEKMMALVQEHIGEIGLDGTVDCAGIEATVNEAIDVTRNGGEIVIAALFSGTPVIPLRMVQRSEKKIIGTQMYTRADFEKSIELIEQGKVRFQEMITHKFPLERAAEAFTLAASKNPEVGKVIVHMER